MATAEDKAAERLLQDIKDRDAQTGPVVGWGSKYDHSRIQHTGYHRDSYELAAGDRHELLERIRAQMQNRGLVEDASNDINAMLTILDEEAAR
jgi:hypothetical protein